MNSILHKEINILSRRSRIQDVHLLCSVAEKKRSGFIFVVSKITFVCWDSNAQASLQRCEEHVGDAVHDPCGHGAVGGGPAARSVRGGEGGDCHDEWNAFWVSNWNSTHIYRERREYLPNFLFKYITIMYDCILTLYKYNWSINYHS